jgi:hypothetical protein
MFDDALGMAMRCIDSFRDGVRDSFGLSIVTDVLAPILKDIESLRGFNEEFRRQASAVDRVLEDTRAIHFHDEGRT